jgi:hypothetical protein
MEQLPGAEPDPLAALWWLDEGADPAAVEREAWRQVAAFEARERWQALAGPAGPRSWRPVVAAVAVDDGGPPALGVLLALEWRDGRRVPLPYVVLPAHPPIRDATALAALAERSLRGRDLGVEPGAFTSALAAILPAARECLVELAAVRHEGGHTSPGRRAALRLLTAAAAEAHRTRAPAEHLDQALGVLTREMPAGLDRLVGDLARSGDAALAAERIVRASQHRALPVGPPLAGPARLALLAALAVVTECPSR